MKNNCKFKPIIIFYLIYNFFIQFLIEHAKFDGDLTTIEYVTETEPCCTGLPLYQGMYARCSPLAIRANRFGLF